MKQLSSHRMPWLTRIGLVIILAIFTLASIGTLALGAAKQTTKSTSTTKKSATSIKQTTTKKAAPKPKPKTKKVCETVVVKKKKKTVCKTVAIEESATAVSPIGVGNSTTELPICEFDSATSCRVVPGITKSTTGEIITSTTQGGTSGSNSGGSSGSSSSPSSGSGSSSGTTTGSSPAAPSCTSNTRPTFTSHITDMSKVTKVSPPPMLLSATNLKTHSYISVTGKVPVYAPVAATLQDGVWYQEGNPGGEYSVTFKISCEVTFRFDHITAPTQAIRDALNQTIQSDTRAYTATKTVTVAAGEQIGETTGTIYYVWDFGVYNSSTKNKFANDSTWNWSDIATTAVCPFDYFPESLRNAYREKFGPINANVPVNTEFCS